MDLKTQGTNWAKLYVYEQTNTIDFSITTRIRKMNYAKKTS